MNWQEQVRGAFSVLVLVAVGIAYYIMTELIDRNVLPLVLDQGAYVLSARDPAAALSRWNFFSYGIAILVSGLVSALALMFFARYGHWLETLPSSLTAVGYYLVAFYQQLYRPYPVIYDLLEILLLFIVLPAWFLLLRATMKRRHARGAA